MLSPERVKVLFNKQIKNQPIVSEIRTNRLSIRPIFVNDKSQLEKLDMFKSFSALVSDPVAMKLFNNGLPKDEEFVKTCINGFSDDWQKGYPSSGFAVYTKSNKLIGTVAVEVDEENLKPKEKGKTMELWYIISPKYWGKGYGSEAIYAIVNCYIPRVINRVSSFNNFRIKELMATVHVCNIPSQKILKKIGFYISKESINKFGAPRYMCNISAALLKKRYNDYYNQKDQRKWVKYIEELENRESINSTEMAYSDFGQSSNTAKRLARAR